MRSHQEASTSLSTNHPVCRLMPKKTDTAWTLKYIRTVPRLSLDSGVIQLNSGSALSQTTRNAETKMVLPTANYGRVSLGGRLFTHKLLPQEAITAEMYTELHVISAILIILLRNFISCDTGTKFDGGHSSLASGISIPMENLLILYILQDHQNKHVNFSVQIGKCFHGVLCDLNCSIP